MTMNRKTKTYIAIITSILVIAVVFFVIGITAYFQPIPTPPTRTLPKPNAYDYYIAAGKAIEKKDLIKLGYAIITDKPPKSSYNPFPADYHVYTLAEKESLLKKTEKALKLLREGFKYEYMEPPAKSLIPTEFVRTERLAHLLVLEAQVKSAHGDWNSAMNSYLDIMKMCQDIPLGGGMDSRIFAHRWIAHIYLRQSSVIAHLDAKQCKAAALRVEAIRSRYVPFVESLKEDKWRVLRQFNQGNQNYTPTERFLLKQFLRSYIRYMDQLIEREKFRYPIRPPAPKEPKYNIPALMFLISTPDPDYARFSDTKSQVLDAMLNIELALRAYRLEHGKYPKSLAELAPSYIREIPEDEFAKTGKLRYKLNGDKYILYSVGPDGIDNGGKPSDETIRLTRERMKRQPPPPPHWKPIVHDRYYVEEASEGDIVAGVNR